MNKKADTGPQGSGEKETQSLEVSETALRFRVERRGLASLLYAILRPKDARAAFVNANSLNLMHGSGYTKIPIEDISSVKVETGPYWSRIRFHHTAGSASVSGLSRDDSREFTGVLETARISCWRRKLEPEIAELQAILEYLEQMKNPSEHMASVFLELRRDAEKAVNQFAERWPKSLPNAPETRLLKKVQNLLEDPEFLRAEEIAKIHWWRQKLTTEIETLHSVLERLKQLASPSQYQASSIFRELRQDAEKAVDQFVERWPKSLPNAPEFLVLKSIQEFLEDPERLRAEVNNTFVESELKRSQEFLDRIEARPLTEEQRRAVVVDEDRNLVVAAAGSGKTSVIVAKAGWLLHRKYLHPSELLLLAFAKDAQKEMETRIRKRLGQEAADGMTVRTFHSLGMAITGEAEGRRPALAKAAESENALFNLLKDIVNELTQERKFYASLLMWFQSQFAHYRSEHEFSCWGEYWDYIRRHEIISLKGERVRSYEECEIANFLYLNGVSYEYERIYEHETATPEKGPYKPDFYLNEAGLYIEHFGLDISGNTAPHVPRIKYKEEMKWKRRTHAEHGTTLIETFSHEHTAGKLTENLAEKLRAHGVSLSPIPREEFFTMLNGEKRIDPFIRLLATFLKHFKGAQLTFLEVARRAASHRTPLRAEIFLALFRPVFERYGETLAGSGQIDFHDMISRATDHVEAGRYKSPFACILVDEFQDISPGRARLLKALLEKSPGARLFAVGDDWQAIYRFAGSDIGIMRKFKEHFGDYERIDLGTTFRCDDRIASVSTEFILRNPAQISKTVASPHRAEVPCVHVGLEGEQRLSQLNETLDRIAEEASAFEGKSSVLLLGRYNHTRPKNLSTLTKKYSGLSISYKTVHRSKGLEADYVVVLDLCAGKHGFPSEIDDDPLFDLVLAAPEDYPNAEERRLFYVALTRARRRVFLLAEGGPVSPFVTELLEDGYDVTVFGRAPEDDVHCPVCIKGHLVHRVSKRNGGDFYGCSNYPYCDHTQRPCPVCGKGLLVKEGKVFRCRDCGQSIEACPECGGWLQMKNGQYGRFWGCSNYPSCTFTRDHGEDRQRARH